MAIIRKMPVRRSQRVKADRGRDEVEARNWQARANDSRDHDRFAFTAEEEVWPVKSPMDRGAPQLAHQTTAPVLKSVLRMFVADTRSAMTSTSIMMRRANSLISPPKISMAPVMTTPISETA